MNPQIASGNPYNAGAAGSGIGPVYAANEDTYGQTMGAFTSAYSLADQWNKEKAAQAAAKAARLKKEFDDLDFTTKGINPAHADYFLKGKQALTDFMVKSYNEGADPNDPKFLAAYQTQNGAKKAYTVMRDLSIEHQAQNAKDLAALAADKTGEYDYEKSIAGLKAQASKPVELVAKDGIQSGLVRNGFNEAKAIQTKMKDIKPNEGTYVGPDGQVHDTKELAALDPKLGVRPRILDLAQSQIDSDPQYKDSVMKRFLATPPEYQESMIKRAQSFTQKGHAVSAEALFAYPTWEPYAYSGDKGGKWTPSAEAYARQSAKHAADDKHDEKMNQFENQRDAQIYIGSPAAYFTGTDGLKHIRNPWSIPVKTYVDQSSDTKGKVSVTKVPATITDVIHLGVTNDSGLPLVKVQDSYSINHPNNAKLGTDENGYYSMDMNDLLISKRQAANPKDWTKVQNSWKKFMEDRGAWDNGVVNAKAEGLSEMDPQGYDYVNKDQAIQDAQAAQNGPKGEGNLSTEEKAAVKPTSSIQGLTPTVKKDWSKYKRK